MGRLGFLCVWKTLSDDITQAPWGSRSWWLRGDPESTVVRDGPGLGLGQVMGLLEKSVL